MNLKNGATVSPSRNTRWVNPHRAAESMHMVADAQRRHADHEIAHVGATDRDEPSWFNMKVMMRYMGGGGGGLLVHWLLPGLEGGCCGYPCCVFE